ncbi:MAG: hypothetical protein ACWA5W_10095 [Phycisphaerales bacterium]
MPCDESTTRHLGLRDALGYALVGLVVALGFLSIGDGGTLSQRAMGVGRVLLLSGWIPAIYLLGSYGWGRGCFGLARITGITGFTGGHGDCSASTHWIIALGLGLVVNLSLAHFLGMLGWLGPISAWGISGVGLLLVIHDLRGSAGRLNTMLGSVRLNLIGVSFIVGAVLVVVMSCNPPGVSCDSEFGGFDELSYHLELPRMWMESGRIWPSEESVYSYLPGYLESAYVQMAALTGPISPSPDGTSVLWRHGGQIAMATHLFSAFLAILCALAMGTLVGRMLDLFAPQHHYSREVYVGSARAMMICLPWVLAVGTIAYNELAVVLLSISALAVAIEPDWPSTKHSHTDRSVALRAGIVGVLVAGACCCKLTAIFLVAPSIGVVLLASIPPKRWGKPIAVGCVMGMLVLLPWMIRNELSAGNPVFPLAAGLFGDGHWSRAQHEIFSRAHHFDGSVLDRLRLLVLPDPDGQQHVSRFRGLTNLQWGLVPMAGIIGLGILLARSTQRRLGVIALCALGLPIVGWLMLTHLQSRFLVPIAPVFIAIAVLGMASVPIGGLSRALMGIISGGGAAWLVMLASVQSGGNPSLLIDLGARVFLETGIVGDPPWSAVVNEQLESGETVYLLGDATPVYVRSPMIWNTVYDHWLIEEAIAQAPTDPEAWSMIVRDAGVDVVVVSFDEIGRYAQSGWLPASIIETLDSGTMREWIIWLGEPIYTWEHPADGRISRAMYRLNANTRTTP